jgi:hypothetical protein
MTRVQKIHTRLKKIICPAQLGLGPASNSPNIQHNMTILLRNTIMDELRNVVCSSNDTSSSDSSSDSTSPRPRLDEFGRPLSRPVFSSIGESSVLMRARQFLPLMKDASLTLSDPSITKPIEFDLKLPSDDLRDSDSETESVGVEIDVGLGVFDVNGAIDEKELEKSGTQIIDMEGTEIDMTSSRSTPLIQEL